MTNEQKLAETKKNLEAVLEREEIVAIGAFEGMDAEGALKAAPGLSKLCDHFRQLIVNEHPEFGV